MTRVAVVGAGLIGVTTTAELVADGHEVTVVERRGGIAGEASFSHAGLTAPGNLVPWSDPLSPGNLLVRALQRDSTHSVASRLDSSTLTWLWRHWRASKPRAARAHLAHLHRLAAYSHERFRALCVALEIDHEATTGTLVLFRDPKSAERIHARLAAARELCLRMDALHADQCRALEPGLNPDIAFCGGVHLPHAGVGNARQFTLLLRNEAQRLGARFQLHSDVRVLRPAARRA